MRTQWSWIVLGAVGVLLFVAGVDAFRPDGETAALTTESPTTTAVLASSQLTRCTEREVSVSIEILGGQAATVVRHIGDNPCHLRPVPPRIALVDGSGNRLRLAGFSSAPVGGDLFPGSEQTANFPEEIVGCDRRGPFGATVTVGQFSAHRTGLSGSEVGCLGA
jgi:hypothetical protein